MKGRKPKPLATLRLTGQYRADRHKDRENAPQPKPAMPKRPSWLKGEARRTWDRLSPELVRLGLLSELDVLFASYCAEWGLYAEACRQLTDIEACIEKTTNGNQIQKAIVGIKNRALANCLKIAAEYGLSPSSRTRLRVHVGARELDPLEELIERSKAKFFKQG